MSRVAMSRAALVAARAQATADATAGAAALVAGNEARRSREALDVRIANAMDASTGSGPAPASIAIAREERYRRELVALVERYPIGSTVSFRSYDPTLRPRDWRRTAERSPWGLRRDDRLDVVGYGATIGFPEGLSVRRATDGRSSPEILVFPDELGGDRMTCNGVASEVAP